MLSGNVTNRSLTSFNLKFSDTYWRRMTSLCARYFVHQRILGWKLCVMQQLKFVIIVQDNHCNLGWSTRTFSVFSSLLQRIIFGYAFKCHVLMLLLLLRCQQKIKQQRTKSMKKQLWHINCFWLERYSTPFQDTAFLCALWYFTKHLFCTITGRKIVYIA